MPRRRNGRRRSRAARVGLPLLLEDLLDRGARHLHVDQRVGEGLHVRRLLVGQRGGVAAGVSAHVLAQAAGVHEGDLRRAGLGGGRRPALHLGDEVAQGGLATAVLGAAGEPRPVERTGDLAELDGTQDVALGDGGVDDRLDLVALGGGRRGGRAPTPVGADDRVGLRRSPASVTVLTAKTQLVEVRAVLTGGHDADGPLIDVVVGEVGVTGDDRADVGVDTVDDPAERVVVGAGVGERRGRARPRGRAGRRRRHPRP